jgi:hypothetical protein
MAVLLSPSLSLAQPSETHWLVGRWDGRIAEFLGRDGARTLEVTRVDPGGLAQATWYTTGRQIHPAQEVTVIESRVKVITVAGSVVNLTRDGESLIGTFVQRNGRSFAIKMVKSPGGPQLLVGSNALDPRLKSLIGIWEGRVLRHGARVLVITENEGQLVARYGIPGKNLGRVNLSTEMVGSLLTVSFVTGAGSNVELKLLEEDWLSGVFVLSGGLEFGRRSMDLQRKR